MKISTVVFDFFGVISSEVAPFWFAERYPEEEAKRLKDEYLSPADRGDIDEEELFGRLSALSGEPAEEIDRDFMRRAVINPDTVALIEELRRKYRVALLSNAQASWLHKILKANDLYRLFETMVISGEEHIIKPEPEIFRLLVSRMGISPSEAVFLDDNPTNAEAARAVGMHGIVFKNAEDAKNELRKLGVEI